MATAPEQDKPKATRNRAKTEHYDVFKRSDTGGWLRVNDPSSPIKVNARGYEERRKLAIAIATEPDPEESKDGEYATCLAGQFVTMTRKRKVEPTDIWE